MGWDGTSSLQWQKNRTTFSASHKVLFPNGTSHNTLESFFNQATGTGLVRRRAPEEIEADPGGAPEEIEANPGGAPEEIEADPGGAPEEIEADPGGAPEEIEADPGGAPEEIEADPGGAPDPQHVLSGTSLASRLNPTLFEHSFSKQ